MKSRGSLLRVMPVILLAVTASASGDSGQGGAAGAGATFDPTKLRELPAGSYARLPTDQPHFNLYKGETIIQLHGIGPYDVIYVNPADDPSKKGKAR